jgi:sodium/proline symporter
MSIKSEKEMRVSQVSGIIWTGLILLMATAVALVAHEYLGSSVADNKSMVFINMVKDVFKVGPLAIIGGVLLSAIVAASMSSADSQLLASSSAFVSDFYKSAIKENPSSKEIKWLSRIAVIFIAIIAFVIATLGLDDIMALVSAAWSIFGSAFGPAILLALYWKRLNYKGCVWGIVVGFVVSILWLVCFNLEYYIGESLIFNTGVYEIVPGFISGLVTAIVVSLSTKAPKKEVTDLFTQVASYKYDGKTEFEEVA